MLEERFHFKGLALRLPYIPTPKNASFYTTDVHHQKTSAKNPFVCNVNPFVLTSVSPKFGFLIIGLFKVKAIFLLDRSKLCLNSHWKGLAGSWEGT